jgi:hypothetical protein
VWRACASGTAAREPKPFCVRGVWVGMHDDTVVICMEYMNQSHLREVRALTT